MKRLVWSALDEDARAEALARPRRRRDPEVVDVVRRIFDDVEREGWSAVCRWSRVLDRKEPSELTLAADVVDRARAALGKDDLAALDLAVENVRRYHEATKPQEAEIEIAPGVRCRTVWRPIESCGLYAPGGTAPLFSTLIMTAAPARVAGVPNLIAATPPSEAGLAPAMIAAAALCGLQRLWLVGGAQAIAALTFGAGVPRAQKLFGPGNAYVAEAKRYAASLPNGPAIDLPAGPSELMVIADESADPAVVAADLLSQAEHARDAQVVFVALSQGLADAVAAEIERQVATLPRAEIARAALANARLLVVSSTEQAAEAANAFAGEHLSVQLADAEPLLAQLKHAGAVFIGRFSAETFGDYVCGPSHVLPTDGAARSWSGLNVGSFMKSFVVQELSQQGARSLAAPAARLARLEGLEAHARAADLRAL